MKSAFIIQPQQDFTDFVAFARDEGVDGVELMYFKPEAVEAFSRVAERKRVLDDHGVAVSAVATWHVGLADPPGSDSADIIARGMDYAAELGASCFFTGAGEPEGDNPAAALADCYEDWRSRAEERNLDFCCYLGHKGSYIDSEDVLAEALKAVPNLGLKIDPVGLIRNLDADPNDILFRFGANLTYFHGKGLTRLRDGEIEPPPGFDALRWDVMFGILLEHGYDGFVSAEPHGPYWAREPERRKAYIRHTLRVLGPYMADG